MYVWCEVFDKKNVWFDVCSMCMKHVCDMMSLWAHLYAVICTSRLPANDNKLLW